MSLLANALLSLAQLWANIRGRTSIYELSQNKIQMSFEKPSESQRAFDFETYENGQLFLKGYANPIYVEFKQHIGKELSKSKTKYEVIPSLKYKLFMKMDLAKQAFLAEELKLDRIFWLVIGILGEHLIIGLIIIILVI